MKTIAVPLLLAGSARAQAKRSAMMQDYEVPKPILIATAWTDGKCTDTTVTAKLTALTTASSALALLETDGVALKAVVATKVAEKKTAVDAVIAKNEATAAKLALDDAAQQKEMTLKAAQDEAVYALATATAAATAAATAKTAADTAVTAATTVQTAMNTAATAALAHYTAEQAETASLTASRNTASTTYTTENNKIANLTSLMTAAQGLMNTKKSELDTKTASKTWASAVKTKMNAALVLAVNDLNAGTAGSSAKVKADADTALAGTPTTELTTASGAWDAKASLTVAAFTEWLLTTYTTLGAAVCATATAKADAANTDANCATACTALLAWTITNNMPSSASVPAGDTYCFGYEFDGNTNACKLQHTAIPTKGSDTTGYSCKARKKSAGAVALFNANELSKTSGTLDNTMQTKFTTWLAAQDLVDAKQWLLDGATKYKTELDTLNTAANTASSTADTEYNTTNGEYTPLVTDYNTKNTNLTTQTTLVATKLAEWDSLKAQVTAQTAEEAAQLAIKGLADTDKTAQDALVTTLTTAATTAATAKTTADTAVTTATTAKTAADTAYSAQVTVAAGTATDLTTPLADLVTLRATAATATTALTTAVANDAANELLIAADKAKVAVATAAHLAAIVDCKEAEYDKYAAALAAAEATRASNITKIEGLVDAAIAAKPAAGAKGARCEKAMSNGTFRPRRDEATCAEGLCCGAAKIPVGKAVMIIETCQAKDASTYSYALPRAPMATTMPTGTDYPFTCIEGAQKLAAAASALAAAVYMLA